MKPWLSDPDVDIHVGDALEVLRGLPDGSVDCCVTSPPYWGLRDYGTEGQLGLEATPDLYVTAMVAVFAEVRRVLADHGTLWLNIGDSFAQGTLRHRRDVSDTDWAKNYGHVDNRVGTAVGGLKPKDLCGIPWRVAFALQQDGWWLRSDIIWAKPNPMPESVTDRPTKAHEYVFLLSKRPSYWFDQEAVREQFEAKPQQRLTALKDQPLAAARRAAGVDQGNPQGGTHVSRFAVQDENLLCGCIDAGCGQTFREDDCGCACHAQDSRLIEKHRTVRPGIDVKGGGQGNGLITFDAAQGRNVRSVWEIATQPYPDAHFATFPEELPRRAILAGCPEWVCATCGKARERLVERSGGTWEKRKEAGHPIRYGADQPPKGLPSWPEGTFGDVAAQTVGWSDCGHAAYRPGTVLDPFLGSGTTAHVARKHGRRCVGIELNETYAELAARRLQQLSLLAEGGYA